jgi:hypothetical protein
VSIFGFLATFVVNIIAVPSSCYAAEGGKSSNFESMTEVLLISSSIAELGTDAPWRKEISKVGIRFPFDVDTD